ncbi:MAG: NUDIX domain-containing protein [Frankiaceae bacterium]
MSAPVDPRDELLDVVDDDDRVLGQARREDVYARRLRHRTVMVVVRNPAGQVLVHRRTASKLIAPSMHDMMIGGVVGAGESYDACAAREVAEEVGVTGARLRRALAFRLDLDDDRVPPQWVTGYETTWAGPIVPQESEIAWWTWLDEAELDRRLAAGTEEYCPDSVEAWRRLREAGPQGSRPSSAGEQPGRAGTIDEG